MFVETVIVSGYICIELFYVHEVATSVVSSNLYVYTYAVLSTKSINQISS